MKSSSLNDIEKIFQHGLIQIDSKMSIKDKTDLSIVYTPGVGHCCTEIERDPDLFYEYTIANNAIYIISNGSEFHADYLSSSPSFMLPKLELQSYVYKSLANISAFPLVFDSKIIKTATDLLWLVEKMTPSVNGIELFEVSNLLIEPIFSDLEKLQKVIILPDLRKFLLKTFSSTKDPSYLTSMIIAIALKAASKLRFWGVLKSVYFELLASEIVLVYNQDFFKNEFELKKTILRHVLSIIDKQNLLECDSFVDELHADFLSEQIQNEIFYRDFSGKNYNENSLFLHQKLNGMIRVSPSVQIGDLKAFLSERNLQDIENLCKKIFDDPELDLIYTVKKNYCSIVTNGTAILGLGDIGPRAGSPVMEGKICLFKQLGRVNVIPVCLGTKSSVDTIKATMALANSWNAINLEDIAAPNCFEVEEKLNHDLKIPVFHDDQHGTAIVCLAALINALKIIKKSPFEVSLVINGAGAAGKAINDLLIYYKFQEIIVVDTKGAIYEGREDLSGNQFKQNIAERTNRHKVKGTLANVIKERDIFIGVSAPNVLTFDMVRTMNQDPIIFALANPNPEILPDLALEAGAKIVATGRSDFPNQINNSIVFPGVFRGIIDGKIKKITMEMKMQAAIALSNAIADEELSTQRILPYSLDPRCAKIISESFQKSFKNDK